MLFFSEKSLVSKESNKARTDKHLFVSGDEKVAYVLKRTALVELSHWLAWEKLVCQEFLTKNQAFRAGLVKKPIQKPFYHKAKISISTG